MAIPKRIKKPSEHEINKRVKSSIDVAGRNQSAPEVLRRNLKNAAVVRGKKKIVGRPAKPEHEKLSEKVLVSFTKEEFSKLSELSRGKYGIVIPVPAIIRGLLKEISAI